MMVVGSTAKQISHMCLARLRPSGCDENLVSAILILIQLFSDSACFMDFGILILEETSPFMT